MSAIETIREQLLELESAASEAESHPDSFALALMVDGINQLRSDLQRDLDIALRPQLDVRIEGKPVVDHEIRVDALSRLLHSLQESISSIAQALTGEITARAPIPVSLRERTALNLTAVYPGSFGATLRGPATEVEDSEDPLFLQPTLLDQAVDAVLDLVAMAASETVDDDPIIEAVLPLGSRAFKHLRDLSESVVDTEMEARFEWRHLGIEERQATMTRSVAQRLDDVLGRNKMTEVPTTITGRLGTASDIRNRVEIEVETGEIIPAKVAEEIAPTLARFFTHRVQADVIVTTVRSTATGAERKSYLVTGLVSLPDSHEQQE